MYSTLGAVAKQIQIVFTLQPLLDDLHMQQAQKAAAEAESQRHRILRLEDERGVVEAQALQGVAQQRILVAIHREQPGEDHRLGGSIASERLRGWARGQRNRIAHLAVFHVLEARGDVANLTRRERLRGDEGRAEVAHLQHLSGAMRLHHQQAICGGDSAIDDANIGDDTLIGVILGIEDERPQRLVIGATRRRHALHHRFENLLGADALFGRRQDGLLAGDADHILDLFDDTLRLGAGQVDLVDNRDEFEVGLERQIEIRQRLRLDALRGVHHQNRALARRQTARHLIGEIDVSGGVDEIQFVFLAIERGVAHPHRLRLDGDALLAFEIHLVEHLLRHVTPRDGAREFQQPIRKGGFAVVDMGDDTKVANVALIHTYDYPDRRRAGNPDATGFLFSWHAHKEPTPL